MIGVTVIARANRGEPLRRLAVKAAKGHVYLINPERIEAVERGDSSPIGFPDMDVFKFDFQILSELTRQWQQSRQTDSGLWNRLERFNPASLEAAGSAAQSAVPAA